MKQIFLLTFSLLMTLVAYSQQADQVIIAPAGNSDSNNSIVLDWTIGEVLVQTLESSSGLLTEGFHQPILIIEAPLSTTEIDNVSFSVYPNPTASSITIDIEIGEEAILYLHSSTGSLLKSKQINSPTRNFEWNLSEYPSGLYLITLKDTNGALINSCRISKSNL